ncbi:MAG: YjfB family protein [Defluviitaleaceae bacterium]|nr:YjfB family protein [Defluviitaleaceae bacterium]
MDMGLVSLATQMSHANTMREVGVGMVGKALDQMELLGEQLAMMIDATNISVPTDGSTIDIRI